MDYSAACPAVLLRYRVDDLNEGGNDGYILNVVGKNWTAATADTLESLLLLFYVQIFQSII